MEERHSVPGSLALGWCPLSQAQDQSGTVNQTLWCRSGRMWHFCGGTSDSRCWLGTHLALHCHSGGGGGGGGRCGSSSPCPFYCLCSLFPLSAASSPLLCPAPRSCAPPPAAVPRPPLLCPAPRCAPSSWHFPLPTLRPPCLCLRPACLACPFASFPLCLFLLYLQHPGAFFLLLSLSPVSCLLTHSSQGLSLKGFIRLTIPLTVLSLSLCPCVPRSLCVGGDGGCLWRRVYWLLHSSCRPVATATRSEGPHCSS